MRASWQSGWKKTLLFFLLIGGGLLTVCAQKIDLHPTSRIEAVPHNFESEISLDKKPENRKLVAALLTIGLGPLGAHRIYLGTSTKVPIIYVLTLGGGLGIIPLIDLICILSTKDLSQYKNNSKVIMW